MANDTLLDLVQQAAGELGLPIPPTVAGSEVAQTMQYLYMLNGKARQVVREFEWQATQKIHTFVTQYLQTTGTLVNGDYEITAIPDTSTILADKFQVIGPGVLQATVVTEVVSPTAVLINQAATASGVAQSLQFCQTAYDMPTDYDRLIDNTEWDRSKHWQILGPITTQQQAWLNSGYIATGPRIQWQIQGNRFVIWPPQTGNDVLGFTYCSKNWVYAAGDTQPTKQKFTADTDTCIFSNEFMVLAIKLCLFEVKSFDTTAVYRDYTSQLDIEKAYDQASATLSMAPRNVGSLITWLNIPDSFPY